MKNSVSTLALAGALSFSSAAWAQTAPPVAAPDTSSPPTAAKPDAGDVNNGNIQDIIVTAQRREERLQDVPIAVNAVSANTLTDQGVNRINDLAFSVPGLNIERSAQTTVYFLRGVGTGTIAPGADASVPTYVDGVYQSFVNGGLLSLNNVERVEVLKGPQGTLFGRNATGGLIQIITKTPTNTPEAYVSLGYGSYDTKSASAYLSGGTGIVAASLSLNYSDQLQGWGKNLFTPAQAGNVTVNGIPITVPDVSTHEAGVNQDFAVAGKIVIRPTDELLIKLSASYARNKSDQGLYASFLPGTQALIQQTGQTVPYTPRGGYWDWNSNSRSIQTNKEMQESLDITYTGKPFSVHSITAFIDATSNPFIYSAVQPTVENPQNSQFSNAHQPVRTFSQELQFLSPADFPIQLIGGGYFATTDTGYLDLTFYRGNNLETEVVRHSPEKSTTYAAFGQGTINLGASTRLTGGLRYTHDHISTSQYFTGGQTSTGATTVTQFGAISSVVPEQSSSFNNVSYRASLDHHFSRDIMAYASFNTGYKSGIYNVGVLCLVSVVGNCPTASIAPRVEPEKLTAYEAGVKTELFDRAVRLNISGFYYNYNNLQVQSLVTTSTGTQSILNNAAKARIKGVDADIVIAPSRALSFTAAAEYLNAKFVDFPNFVPTIPRGVAPYGDGSGAAINAAGNHLTRAPNFTANAGVNYKIPLNTGSLRLNVNSSYNGGFFWDANNRLRERPFAVLNAEIEYAPTDHLSVKVYGRNVTDTKYSSFTDPSAFGDRYRAAAPATFGATFSYKL